eukprot:1865564-Pleurochrysis_carterae.AAC.1
MRACVRARACVRTRIRPASPARRTRARRATRSGSCATPCPTPHAAPPRATARQQDRGAPEAKKQRWLRKRRVWLRVGVQRSRRIQGIYSVNNLNSRGHPHSRAREAALSAEGVRIQARKGKEVIKQCGRWSSQR